MAKRELPFPAIDDKNILGVRSQESEIRMKSERARTFQDLIVWQKTHQSKDLGYTDTTKLMVQLKEVSKRLNAYSKSLTPGS